MKVHPITLPLFVYGTLKKGGKYDAVLTEFACENTKAFTFGTLYHVPYIDEENNPCITVALDPVGVQRVSGELLTFDDCAANNALAVSDDKEFNFSDLSTREKKDRVFIRTIITCYSPVGEAFLAWAYIYVSRTHKPSVLVNVDSSFGAFVEYRAIGYREYATRLQSLKNG